MGRPDADPSAYESQQIQTEYELQPQEYEPNQEATGTISEEYQDTSGNNPQLQPPQFQQPQQQPPQFQQPQLQQTQYQQPQYQQPQFQPPQQPIQYNPAQPNQAYPPQQPAPYPPPQNNPGYQNIAAGAANNPGYQKIAAGAAYPPQPVQFPPKSPQTNQMYANVSPPVMAPQTVYAPSASPQAFQQQGFMPPVSPHKPGPGAQPFAAGIPVGPGGGEAWKSGLFDFMDDPMNALVTALFPCLTFGQIAEIVDDGHTTCGTSGMLYGGIAFCIAMPCLLSCTYRTKLRNKFGLPEAPAPDWVTHFLCEWCALCQEYRELQHRGWDPSIGWQGNLARNQMQPAPVMMAPGNQRMMG